MILRMRNSLSFKVIFENESHLPSLDELNIIPAFIDLYVNDASKDTSTERT